MVVAKEMLYCEKNETIALSLRQSSTDSPKLCRSDNGTRFDIILSWLCRDGQDFCMAAYIALLLLGDSDRASQLRRLTLKKRHIPSVIDTVAHAEVAMHQHILDGIEPLDWFGQGVSESVVKEGDSISSTLGTRIVTLLADLAIVCLVKGGRDLSPVLSMFLKHNLHYSANRTFLLLAGIFLKKLHRYYGRETGDLPGSESTDELLWPVKSLLCIAVARHCMKEALILLDAAAPSELRGFSDEQLCTSLVSLIIGASSFAPSILLSLTRSAANGVQRRYWESISHGQKLMLSLLHINEHYPMLKQPEIRDWILDIMQRAISICANGGDNFDSVPSEWLSSLCIACLSNANCKWEKLSISAPSRSPETTLSEVEDQFGDKLYLHRYENEVVKSAFLASSVDLHELDSDVIIPTLLLLQRREQKWHANGVVSTQTLLNHICTLAGRRSASSRLSSKVRL